MDAYYSPVEVAEAVAGALTDAPANVLDPSCGGGGLLKAVATRFRRARVFGVDLDPHAVRKVRMRFPEWVVSIGDATSRESIARTRVSRLLGTCDAIVINPPFSMNRERRVEAHVAGGVLHCSQAMKHLVAACSNFKPRSAVAVLPESALYSELDGGARAWLRDTYRLTVVAQIDQDAFGGARARTHLVRLDRGACSRAAGVPAAPGAAHRVAVRLRRGTLQMFRARDGRMPLVHTTDLCAITAVGRIGATRHVCPVGAGQTAGYFALVPRVGSFPSGFRLSVLHSERAVQLSDCLFSVEFSSRAQGYQFVREVRQRWPSFLGLMRGTGAAYITMKRLEEWILLNTSFAVAST